MTRASVFGGSLGIMSNARPELPYQCVSKAKSQVKFFSEGEGCGTIKCHLYNTF